MRTRIRVRDVEITTDVKMTRKQLRYLLRSVASVAAAFDTQEDVSTPLGFTVITERLPDELASEPGDDGLGSRVGKRGRLP